MAFIQVSSLTFGYEDSFDMVFEDVSFRLDTSWKLGFIGRNGRGKTTFLRLLLGDYEYQGSITAPVAFSYFPFPVSDRRRDTIDIVEEVCAGYEYWELQRELSLLSVSDDVLYRPFRTLSNGEQTKVLLAALFLKENHFLLIDEPTNHLDVESRQIVSQYLNRQSGFILVSHDREFLDGCIDHVLSINKTNIEVQRGNYSTWYQNKLYQDGYELRENEKLKSEVKRLSTAAKRTSGWSDNVEKSKKGERVAGLRPDRGHIGRKAAKMMKRSKTIEKRQRDALEEKSGLLKNIDTADSLKLSALRHPKQVLGRISDLSIHYGTQHIFAGLDFTIEQGERIALCGKNGCGKSSVLKLILGEGIPYTGTLELASNLVISYVPQDCSALSGDLRDFAEQNQIEESLFKAILRKMDFSREQFEKNISDFSEGQKKKVALAGSLSSQAHLYLWDEPLNYIDVLSRIQIEEMLIHSEITMLFVEHDQMFTHNAATKQVRIGK